jgi:hypothetical protein
VTEIAPGQLEALHVAEVIAGELRPCGQIRIRSADQLLKISHVAASMACASRSQEIKSSFLFRAIRSSICLKVGRDVSAPDTPSRVLRR